MKPNILLMTEQQFKECFENYFEGLCIYASTIVRDTTQAKDIVQNSFIKLWDKGTNIDDELTARAFLYKVVYRLALNAIRDRKTKERHYQQLRGRESAETNYSAEEKELLTKIKLVIDELPERCRAVFLKVRIDGMKYKEVANEMKISEKTVETQMLRAMKYLRQRMADAIVVSALIINESISNFFS